MSNTSSPRGIAALLVLAIVLVLALVVAGAAYFATRAPSNTNTAPQNANVLVSNQNRNSSSNVNVATNTNSAANTNATTTTNESANANTNTSSTTNVAIPAGWTTYDSSQSELLALRSLFPSFTVSYPSTWKHYEELGGLYLAEAGIANLEPQINFSRSDVVLGDSIIYSCKSRLRAVGPRAPLYDVAKVVAINGIDSAYLSYHVDDSLEVAQSDRDGIFVCIPLSAATDFVWARSRSAGFITSFFDAVLATYSLHDRTP